MSERQHSILVVEDDPAIRRGLVDALTFAGYRTIECDDGSQAVALAIELSPNLVLLDVLLPGRNGFEILEELRHISPTLPIIMVPASAGSTRGAHGRSGGADDYVVKPFSPRELLARIKAVLRRSPERSGDVSTVRFGDRVIDLNRREVIMGSSKERQHLSELETAILRYLCVNRGRAIDRDELLHRVWGFDPRGITTRTVDMHIARLREKLGDQSSDHPMILTVRAKGYMIADGVEVDPVCE